MPFGGTRSTYCSPTTERLATVAAVLAGIFGLSQLSTSRSTRTPSLIERERADLADGDAAVGDLGVGEDAAGVREVGAGSCSRCCRTGSWSGPTYSAPT